MGSEAWEEELRQVSEARAAERQAAYPLLVELLELVLAGKAHLWIQASGLEGSAYAELLERTFPGSGDRRQIAQPWTSEGRRARVEPAHGIAIDLHTYALHPRYEASEAGGSIVGPSPAPKAPELSLAPETEEGRPALP